MGKPAARIGDMHTCPASDGPKPHVGGPIVSGSANVLTGGIPQARVTDKCTCVGPIDMIVQGSATVFVNGLPAARIGDMTTHGGVIVAGLPTVLIGDAAGGGSSAGGGASAGGGPDRPPEQPAGAAITFPAPPSHLTTFGSTPPVLVDQPDDLREHAKSVVRDMGIEAGAQLLEAGKHAGVANVARAAGHAMAYRDAAIEAYVLHKMDGDPEQVPQQAAKVFGLTAAATVGIAIGALVGGTALVAAAPLVVGIGVAAVAGGLAAVGAQRLWDTVGQAPAQRAMQAYVEGYTPPPAARKAVIATVGAVAGPVGAVAAYAADAWFW